MKSSYSLQKICDLCNIEFTALKISTRFCSLQCARKSYKIQHRKTQIETANKITQAKREKPLADIKAREFLSVRQTATLLGCCKQTIYNLISSGKLHAVNIKQKKTVVRRCDIDKLFVLPPKPAPAAKPIPKPTPTPQYKHEIKDCYLLSEIKELYGLSDSGVYGFIKRNNVPKYQVGRFVYIPKEPIHALLGKKDNQNK